MKRINLRDFYPDYYSTDYIIEVPDEVADVMITTKKSEDSYCRKIRYHHAQYSLDIGAYAEYDILFRAESPEESYERKVTIEQLRSALDSLSPTQSRRVYAYFFSDQTMEEIGKHEGVSKTSVSESINRALVRLKKYMQALS